MGRSFLAPEVFNCSAPDTGNIEVLTRYGTPEHQARWLKPLLAGEIRSCFAMTEPKMAASDSTNIESSIVCDGDDYVINGHKWYTTNATDPRCEIAIFMGKTAPGNADRHQQSMILVPMKTPGVKVIRPLPVFATTACRTAPPKCSSRMFACRLPICCWAKVADSRSPRAGSGRDASTTACARSAWPSARWKTCAGAR